MVVHGGISCFSFRTVSFRPEPQSHSPDRFTSWWYLGPLTFMFEGHEAYRIPGKSHTSVGALDPAVHSAPIRIQIWAFGTLLNDRAIIWYIFPGLLHQRIWFLDNLVWYANISDSNKNTRPVNCYNSKLDQYKNWMLYTEWSDLVEILGLTQRKYRQLNTNFF